MDRGRNLGAGEGRGGGGWREWHPYHLIRFDEVVDVEEVGPPAVLTVVSVCIGRRPQWSLTPVWAQAQVHHNHQHVDRGQSKIKTGTKTKTKSADSQLTFI